MLVLKVFNKPIYLVTSYYRYNKTKEYLREAGDASNVTFSPAQDSSRSEESSNTLSSYKNSDIFKQIS